MKRLEFLGVALVLLVLAGTPAAIYAGQQYSSNAPHTYTLVARMVEDGGWSPNKIVVHQGEHVHLRVTSADVSHGLSIPDLNINISEIYPGKYSTVDFTPTKAGEYPFACTVMCSPRHGEMQGVIVVLPATSAEPAAASSPATTAPATLPPAAAPAANSQDAQVAAGKSLFATRCAGCHGANAAGGINLGSATSADLRWSSLGKDYNGQTALIQRAILTGKDQDGKDLNAVMPRWQGQLSDQQVKDIIAFLQYGTSSGGSAK